MRHRGLRSRRPRAAVPYLKPDVVLLDILLPLLNGLDAITRVNYNGCTAKYIVMTGRKEGHFIPDALQRGASELLAAIRRVWSGESYLTPLVAEWWEESAGPRKKEKSASELIPRQREILHARQKPFH